MRRASLLLIAARVLLLSTRAIASPPVVQSLSLYGLQIGGTTTMVITGSGLLPQPRLLLPVPIAKARIAAGETAERIEVEITLDESIAPGIYPLRLVTTDGVSGPMAIGIDRLIQRPLTETIESLPVALHGNLTGDRVVRTTFAGFQGQPVVIDVESRRLGANLKPVVRLYNERDVQLAWTAPSPSIAGDARMTITLPADGKYTVELHDRLRRGEAPGQFRLKIGQLFYADRVHPMGVRRGTRGAMRFVSSNLSSSLFTAIDVADDAPSGLGLVSWTGQPHLTGSAPRMVISDHPELVEQTRESNGVPQDVPPAPVGINGCLLGPGEQDRYCLPVTAGQSLRLELWGQRFGSPIDAMLSLEDGRGKPLAESDDQKGTNDPALEWKVPENVDHVVVGVRDLEGRGGSTFNYRLLVTPADQPDFQIKLDHGQLNVASGGHLVVPIRAERHSYAGPIELAVHGLPEGVTVGQSTIAANMDRMLMTLSAGDGRPDAGLISIWGQSSGTERPVVRVAESDQAAADRHPMPLGTQLALAVGQPSPIQIGWEEPSQDDRLVAGGALSARVRLARRDNSKGNIQLALLTNQVMPRKKTPDPMDKNKQIEVDDVERALRLDGAPTYPASVWGATVDILVPQDLPREEWDFAIKAELLADDNKTVLATAMTPARRLLVVDPPAADAQKDEGQRTKDEGQRTKDEWN
jgi:hypothetical protein